MGKRFLVSLLLVVVIVGGVTLGASLIFRSNYNALAELEAQSSPSPVIDNLTELPLQSATVAGEEDTSTSAAVSTPAPTMVSTDDSFIRARTLVADMTLEEKICQMFFVTPEALTGYTKVTQSGAVTEVSITSYPVGGVIYFADNLVTMEQTQEMIANIQNYSKTITGRGLFIGVDEEGGTVARLADNLGTTAYEDMSVYGEAGDTAKAYEIGTTLAADLKSLGFNVDFAPVADVLTNEENTVVQTRSFGSDPELVAEMVAQEVRGLVDGGVLCAPKHFPGHGSTGGDTHEGYAATDRTLEELNDCDLLPFTAAIDAGAPMIMVGHMTMTAIDSEHPASLSSAVVTGILREQLGYDGIIITDSLDMDAISDSYTSGQAAVAAIAAGCDMLLCISNVPGALEAVVAAVEEGTLSESAIDESVERILSAKLRYGVLE